MKENKNINIGVRVSIQGNASEDERLWFVRIYSHGSESERQTAISSVGKLTVVPSNRYPYDKLPLEKLTTVLECSTTYDHTPGVEIDSGSISGTG